MNPFKIGDLVGSKRDTRTGTVIAVAHSRVDSPPGKYNEDRVRVKWSYGPRTWYQVSAVNLILSAPKNDTL